MKKRMLATLFFFATLLVSAQEISMQTKQDKAIIALIQNYSLARETLDTSLLKKVMTEEVDQLVSNGEWRTGIAAAVAGMLQSSTGNPGTRSLKVEKIRLVQPNTAMVDCRYEIKANDGTAKKMWSSFVVVEVEQQWKITAIRNMLPSP